MERLNSLFLSLLVCGGLLGLTACDDNKAQRSPLNQSGEPIIGENFSDPSIQFPNGIPLFVSMIKLQTPALLEKAERGEDGKYKIDEDLKSKIFAEQEEMIAKLQAISSDIKILNRYRLILNALTVEAPQHFAEQINELDGIEYIEADGVFNAPKIQKSAVQIPSQSDFKNETPSVSVRNSMTYIGVDQVHQKLKALNENGELVPVKGQGVKVGVIDTGIDYTHTMLGGSGSVDTYNAINPNQNTAHFPNTKVVGGFDFAGAKFSSGSPVYADRIPVPDANPIDLQGHGTHVAGTVGGLGDGETTYDGAAPEADIYALKVFGDNGGSTADSIVLAALEYAVDPNKDLDIDDKLDVLNLSLGSPYGKAHGLYNQAITNITQGGVVVIVSAGNSGPMPNIVGSPGSSEDAVTVAAGIDYMEHNFKFDAVGFTTSGGTKSIEEYHSSTFLKPRTELTSSVEGKLVPVGIAKELTDEQKRAVKGHIALVDRGEIAFVDKALNVLAAGARGMIVINNQPGDAFGLGGSLEDPEARLEIPGTMITKAVGDFFKQEIESNREVRVNFTVEDQILKPELIGTMGGFSSQGPRSFDALIKPEITGPGVAIMSANVGTGSGGVRLQGTSMSAPHIAGVSALLVQYRRNLDAREIKSLIMNTATLMVDADKRKYSISRQGSGMVNAYRAATTGVVLSKPALSLGKVSVKDSVTLVKDLNVTNPTESRVDYTFNMLEDASIEVDISETRVSLAPGESKNLVFTIQVTPTTDEVAEVDAFVQIRTGGELIGSLPILAVVNRETSTRLDSLVVEGGEAGAGKAVKVAFSNTGDHDGVALMFNLLGEDARKQIPQKRVFTNFNCDLESVGYRIVEREVEKEVEGETQKVMESTLQLSFKTYNPVSAWETCTPSVKVDFDGDGVNDSEIVGVVPNLYSGFDKNPSLAQAGLSTILIDSKAEAQINLEYRRAIQKGEEAELNFLPALRGVFPVKTYSNSTIAILEVPVAAFGDTKKMRIRPSMLDIYGDNIDGDDALGVNNGDWKEIALSKEMTGFYGFPEELVIPKKSSQTADLFKGAKSYENLVVYYPRNEFTLELSGKDQQSQVKAVTFESEITVP